MTPVVLGRDQTSELSIACDVVVIGSGASGAVVATELAEAGQDVVVLEEGPHVRPEDYGRMRPSETLRHMWRDGGTSFAIGLGDSPVINVMMGRCIGGSSVLTGGVCFRVPDEVLAEWVRVHGLTEMTPAGMRAVLRGGRAGDARGDGAGGDALAVHRPVRERRPEARLRAEPHPPQYPRLQRLRAVQLRLPPRREAERGPELLAARPREWGARSMPTASRRSSFSTATAPSA